MTAKLITVMLTKNATMTATATAMTTAKVTTVTLVATLEQLIPPMLRSAHVSLEQQKGVIQLVIVGYAAAPKAVEMTPMLRIRMKRRRRRVHAKK